MSNSLGGLKSAGQPLQISNSTQRETPSLEFDSEIIANKNRFENDDAALVVSFLNGNTQAFESIYAKHHSRLVATATIMITNRVDAADVVHDVFIIAIERLHQLENPSALMPWLFQILRREVYRRHRVWREVTSLNIHDAEISLLPAPNDPLDEGAGAIADEAATILRQSLAGLDRRDQTLFELLARQEIFGSRDGEFSRVLPVVGTNSSTRMMTSRMRERLWVSRSAYLVTRHGQQSCPLLRQVLRNCGGDFRPLIRKRVTRHMDSCPQCTDTHFRFSSVILITLILTWTVAGGLLRWEPTHRVNGPAPATEPLGDPEKPR